MNRVHRFLGRWTGAGASPAGARVVVATALIRPPPPR